MESPVESIQLSGKLKKQTDETEASKQVLKGWRGGEVRLDLYKTGKKLVFVDDPFCQIYVGI